MKNTIMTTIVQTSLNATFPIQPSMRPRLIGDKILSARTSTKTSVLCALILMPTAVFAAPSFFFSTGDPDGLMATGTRPGSNGKIEIETGDDFALNQPTTIDHATFTGLLPAGATVDEVRVEIYRVFPKDSQFPPSGNVPTRVNSPSDVEFLDRDSSAANLTFTTTTLAASFTANNSVLNGIHPKPNQTTGGEGPVTGQEVRFDVDFTTTFTLPTDHYFFVPQVELSNGDFFWLSAPKPILSPGTPFAPGDPDLQSWIRNEDLAPDWLRIGTDIVGPGAGGAPAPTFNAAFSLSGSVPDSSATAVLFGMGFLGFLGFQRYTIKRC